MLGRRKVLQFRSIKGRGRLNVLRRHRHRPPVDRIGEELLGHIDLVLHDFVFVRVAIVRESHCPRHLVRIDVRAVAAAVEEAPDPAQAQPDHHAGATMSMPILIGTRFISP